MRKPRERNDPLARRFDRFAERLRQNDPTAAAEEFARMCHWLRASEIKVPSRTLAAFMEGWIDIFWQCRDHEMMLKGADEAREVFGPSPEWAFARGEALFNLGRFEEARAELEPLTVEDFDEPMVYYLLACLAERRGKDEEACRLFQTSNRLDPNGFKVPMPIDEKQATELFSRSIDDLPEEIARRVEAVPLFVSPFPSDEIVHEFEPPLDPLVMGLFVGQPMGSEASSWPSDQPRIMLFHKNIAKLAGDFDTLDEELRRTLFHEVGHYLGFDEDQLEEMGLG